jgi:hypothetical protein
MDNLPDNEHIKRALDLEVLDSVGQTVKFGSLISGTGKTIVVFIRRLLTILILAAHRVNKRIHSGHFFCGVRIRKILPCIFNSILSGPISVFTVLSGTPNLPSLSMGHH